MLEEEGTVWGYCLRTTSRAGLAHVLLTHSDSARPLWTLVLLRVELKPELDSMQMFTLKQ